MNAKGWWPGGPSGCAQTLAAYVGDNDGPDARVQTEQHLRSCASCRTQFARLAFVSEGVKATPARLDDVTRARMHGRLTQRLAGPRSAPLATPVHAVPSWISSPRIALAAVLLVAFAAVMKADRTPQQSVQPQQVASGPKPAAQHAEESAPAVSPTELNVAAGDRVRATWGDKTRVVLHGPGRMRMLSQTSERMDLELRAGTLIADYHRNGGALLRIICPRMTVEVVGTVFAIDSSAGKVAVARGKVRVIDPQGAVVDVSAGEQWTEDGTIDRNTEIEPRLQKAFADFAVGSAPPRDPPMKNAKPSVRAVRLRAEPKAVQMAAAQPTAPPPVVTPLPLVPDPLAPTNEAPTAPTPTPRPTAPSAEALYGVAETAMARGDQAEASQSLGRLLSERPHHSLAGTARYELAQMALAEGDAGVAAGHLEALFAGTVDPALDEPAGFLRCRVHLLRQRGSEGIACLRRFRADHPRSGRDEEAAVLILRHIPDRCAARGDMDKFLDRYGTRPSAPLVRKWRKACHP